MNNKMSNKKSNKMNKSEDASACFGFTLIVIIFGLCIYTSDLNPMIYNPYMECLRKCEETKTNCTIYKVVIPYKATLDTGEVITYKHDEIWFLSLTSDPSRKYQIYWHGEKEGQHNCSTYNPSRFIFKNDNPPPTNRCKQICWDNKWLGF